MHEAPRSCPLSTRRSVAFVFGAVLLAACSGDGSASTTTRPHSTPAPTAVASSTTTTPATTPTTVAQTTSSTTSPPTTASTTSPASTVAPPATAPIDFDGLEEALPLALQNFVDAFNDALRDPLDQAKSDRLAEFASDSGLEVARNAVQLHVDRNRASRVDSDNPSRVEPMLFTISTAPGSEFVGMDACVVDTDDVVEIGSGPDGSDQVVDDDTDSYLLVFTFRWIDSRFLVSSISSDAAFEGREGCT